MIHKVLRVRALYPFYEDTESSDHRIVYEFFPGFVSRQDNVFTVEELKIKVNPLYGGYLQYNYVLCKLFQVGEKLYTLEIMVPEYAHNN